MSLQRKENNLRRAQERFDRVNKRSKKFQIDFRREQNSRGRFRTRPYIVRHYTQFHGNNRGLLHKTVNLKYRVHGDVPSVTKTLKSWQPKSLKDKVFRANARAVNFAVHDAGRTARKQMQNVERSWSREHMSQLACLKLHLLQHMKK